MRQVMSLPGFSTSLRSGDETKWCRWRALLPRPPAWQTGALAMLSYICKKEPDSCAEQGLLIFCNN